MHEQRCEVCGESVPPDAIRRRGRLRCCPRCAQPPVVADETLLDDIPESPREGETFRRFGVVLKGLNRGYPAEGGTLRMRVATLSSH